MPSIPREKPHSPARLQVRMMQAAVISEMASHILLPSASLKISAAINAVDTASKFSSRDAADAGVACRLYMRRMGAATPPVRTMLMSQGISFFTRGASL